MLQNLRHRGARSLPRWHLSRCSNYKLGGALTRILFVAAVALSLQGCFFFFPIPIGAIDQAVRGSHCVAAGTKVGDTITDVRTGQRLTVTKVSEPNADGTPDSGCGARLPLRAKVVDPTGETASVKAGEQQ